MKAKTKVLKDTTISFATQREIADHLDKYAAVAGLTRSAFCSSVLEAVVCVLTQDDVSLLFRRGLPSKMLANAIAERIDSCENVFV